MMHGILVRPAGPVSAIRTKKKWDFVVSELARCRREFEFRLETHLNQGFTLQRASKQGLIALIDFSQADKVIVQAFELGHGTGNVITGTNRSLKRDRRLWGKYFISENEEGLSKRLCISYDDEESHTIFTGNCHHVQTIEMKFPPEAIMQWLYQDIASCMFTELPAAPLSTDVSK